jgi:hypothetical protein
MTEDEYKIAIKEATKSAYVAGMKHMAEELRKSVNDGFDIYIKGVNEINIDNLKI